MNQKIFEQHSVLVCRTSQFNVENEADSKLRDMKKEIPKETKKPNGVAVPQMCINLR